MKLQSFTTGLSLRLAPYLLNTSDSVVFTNVDYKSGALKPIKDKVINSGTVGIKRYSYYFEPDNIWISKDNPTAYAEFQEKLYYADGINTFKYKNGVEQLLGIAPPTIQPTLTAVNGPGKIVRCDIIPIAGTGDFPTGNAVNYRFVNNNSVTSLTSGPSDIYTVEVDSPNDAVRLTNVGAAFSTSCDVYRQYNGEYRLVGTFTESTGTVIDNNWDISTAALMPDTVNITGTIQYVITFFNSVDGTESGPLVTPEIVVTNGGIQFANLPVSTDSQVDQLKLYRIGGNLTLFSLVATINAGITTYTDTLGDTDIPGDLLQSGTYLPAPQGLKYITVYNAMLIGAVNDKLYFTEIGIPNAWPVDNFLDFPATITGISITQAGMLVHTKTKTYIVTGSRPVDFAQRPHSGDQGCLNHFTIVPQGGSSMWVSADGICVSNGLKVTVLTKDRLDQLVLDTVNAVFHDQVYSVQLTDGRVFFVDLAYQVLGYKDMTTSFLVVALNKLYGYNTNNLFELEKSTNSLLSFAYASPTFIGTGLTDLKLYNELRMNSSGTLIIQVFIDDVIAYSKTFTDFKTHELSLAKASTRGNRLRFTISGPGTVFEISFAEATANG